MLLSIIALFNYHENILDNIKPYLPTGVSRPDICYPADPVDFDVLKNTILLRAGELSLVYSDPDLFRLALSIWSAKNRLTWQNLFDSIYYKYDPLFSKIREYTLNRATANNTDFSETDTKIETDTENRDLHESSNRDISTNTHKNDVEHTTGTENRSNSENHNDTDIHYVQAFNDIGVGYWHEKEKDANNGGSTGTENSGMSSTTTTTANDTAQTADNLIKSLTGSLTNSIRAELEKIYNKKDNGTLNDIITETIHGQRPYQELIKLQREIVEFNLYDYIANQFVHDFCVMLY